MKKFLHRRNLLIASFILAVIGAGFYAWFKPAKAEAGNSAQISYLLEPRDLVISVSENGNIKAQNTEEIRCQVEGRTTIISIVPEGTVITNEDVKAGKVLIELDSSEIKQKLNQQEISYAAAESDFTEARESLEIQIKQNESDVNAEKT